MVAGVSDYGLCGTTISPSDRDICAEGFIPIALPAGSAPSRKPLHERRRLVRPKAKPAKRHEKRGQPALWPTRIHAGPPRSATAVQLGTPCVHPRTHTHTIAHASKWARNSAGPLSDPRGGLCWGASAPRACRWRTPRHAAPRGMTSATWATPGSPALPGRPLRPVVGDVQENPCELPHMTERLPAHTRRPNPQPMTCTSYPLLDQVQLKSSIRPNTAKLAPGDRGSHRNPASAQVHAAFPVCERAACTAFLPRSSR